MLGEAHQIPGLIRFVARIISGIFSWIKEPRKGSPLSTRSTIKYREFNWGGLSYKSYKSEQIGPPIERTVADPLIEAAQTKRLLPQGSADSDEQGARPT